MKLWPILFSLIIFSCTIDKLDTPTKLEGKWVEISTTSDTLSFELFGDKETLMLDRGRELRNGFLLPKPGSGPYEYQILKNKIDLRWYASSNGSFFSYYFDQTRDQIKIENFYDVEQKGKIETFKKLK